MNHYNTLGVEASATPEEIKQAYRRRSSQAHPDKGGTAEEMANVNKAYDVLRDADRRAQYDRTGDDAHRTSLDDLARDMALQFLAAALQREGNVVNEARAAIESKTRAALKTRENLERQADRLERRRPKITVSKGPNLVHMLIDQQVTAARQQIEQLIQWGKIAGRARELLDLHDSSEAAFTHPGLGGLGGSPMFEMLFEELERRSGPGRDGPRGWMGIDQGRDEQHRSGRTPPPAGAAEHKRDRWGRGSL
jgi:hypothetical protein